MKKIYINKPYIRKRQLKKLLRRLCTSIRDAAALPAVKPAALLIISLSLLLILTPYLLTRLPFAQKGEAEKELFPQTSFDPVQVPETIKVCRTEKDSTETVEFEDYVKGVVAGEMPASFHEEALKAQSVAARTYSLARVLKSEESGCPEAHPDASLCDTTHCQVYRSKAELDSLKGDEWMNENWKKICSAVDSTEGQLLYYNGELVEQALFHSSSGGRTENSEDVFASAVPYLVSVESPYEDDATHQDEKNTFSLWDFKEKLQEKYPNISFGDINADNIKVISRSSGGRVEKMQVGDGIIEGVNIREALALPSANFTVNIDGDEITFTSNGSGHGVGMSQYGADGMAKEGFDYKEILSHYYRGTVVF